ncbi:olfactory receptor 14I1-like [Eublepharis macularius]|uniref:Olfactory receptor 14I1-like n=1 Tax=Eublepharis macularius TaxID=481883 RepID=A0AA97K4V5_EUBMA|nr:olfactory receptor 14I1-like [Eublepharis macularius]
MNREDKMANLTSTSQFLLLEFSEIRELQVLHFFVFLTIYLIAITGNLLMFAVIAFDHHLHTPMYFFLMNLAVLDLASVSVIVPKALANSLMNSRSISYSGCVAQVFFYFAFQSSDLAILTIMAHDRYVAICNPLQYETVMHKGACIHMVFGAWVSGVLYATLQTAGTFTITFCSNIVNQFFCEIPQLLKLSCNDIYLIEVGFLVFGCSLGIGCFVFIVRTYIQIFSTVLQIPSVQGQKKALSTCIPHITVVSLLLFTGLFVYARPPTDSSSYLDIALAVMYAIIPPLLNPFIYTMRNKDIKTAVWKLYNLGHSSKSIFA